MKRRNFIYGFLTFTGAVGLWGAALKLRDRFWPGDEMTKKDTQILQQFPLNFQWPTVEPFLFCVHHYDFYPTGNGKYGPAAHYYQGRNIGQDFEEKDGFRMYHGEEVPGFPVHPHRGFETITIVRKGYVDHADSLGAAGRYGEGDVQWMTAGAGVQHSEMFPLLKEDKENTLELFQIWLNLPRKSKMVPAHFKMMWAEQIPQVSLENGKTQVTVIAGNFGGKQALPPPPDSWAADVQNNVSVLLVKMEAGGVLTLPAASGPCHRMLYFFEGQGVSLGDQELNPKSGFLLKGEDSHVFTAKSSAQFLVLQAKPIGEPTVQHGPFVMNSREDILQTIQDYQKTQFGGWPWNRHDMVHGNKIERFAKYPDGKIERPS